jgi:hypothetical protein
MTGIEVLAFVIMPIVLAAGGWFGTWMIERADRPTSSAAE